MADEQQTGTPPPKIISPTLPSGSMAKNYGGVIGAGGVALALLEVFRQDPHSSIALFAEFGPKYILWAFIAYIVWDLLKKAIRVANKGADNIGLLASNAGVMASAVTELANRSDRNAEEMRRTTAFAATQAERAVEISNETNQGVKEIRMLLERSVAMPGVLGAERAGK